MVDYHGLFAEGMKRGFARCAFVRNVYAFLRIVEKIMRITVSGEHQTMVGRNPFNRFAFGGLPNDGCIRLLHAGGCPKNHGDAVIDIRAA